MGGVQGGSPYAYLSLTDVCINTILSVQFVFLTENEVLFHTEITIDCNDRLQTIEVILPLPALPIQKEGVYELEIVCEDEIIGYSRITAKEAK